MKPYASSISSESGVSLTFALWQTVWMPMRTECKQFESRTYPTGDTVQKCNLDLAPEAPWRCPDNCPKFDRRLADQGWVYGSLVPHYAEEPPGLGDGSAAALLDEAEDIINSVGAQMIAEVEREREANQGSRWKFWRRR
jgi:hypothetical protein